MVYYTRPSYLLRYIEGGETMKKRITNDKNKFEMDSVVIISIINAIVIIMLALIDKL